MVASCLGCSFVLITTITPRQVVIFKRLSRIDQQKVCNVGVKEFEGVVFGETEIKSLFMSEIGCFTMVGTMV